MIIPLFVGCLLNTFFPAALNIGGFTTGMFRGTNTVVAMYIFCSGANIKVRQAGIPLYKGAMLLLIKLFIAWGIGILLNTCFGPAGILGITPFAVIAAITNSNGALYTALAGEFGDSTDVGALSMLSLNDGPFFTLIAMGCSGMAAFSPLTVIASVFPIVLGFILGNLDEEFGDMLKDAMPVLMFFSGIVVGTGMSLIQVVQGGLQGILLGLLCVVSTGYGTYIIYSLINRVVLKKKRSPLGAAVGTVAGNAVATPAIIAEADPSLAGYAPMVTAQVSSACLITAILCPMLTTYLAKRDRRLTELETKTAQLHTQPL